MGGLEYTVKTRKSSCVNARGIPTAAYQVLLGGVPPPPSRGTPWPGPMRGTPQLGYPHRAQWGVPRVPPIRVPPQPGLTGGLPPSPIGVHSQPGPTGGVPPLLGLMGGHWGYPHWGTSPPGPGWGTPLPGPSWGTPPPPAWTWLGYLPQVWTYRWMDRCVSKYNLPSYYVHGR